jgi:PAS domain S-box-containing protein
MAFPLPVNEELRLKALEGLGILDTQSDPFFDSITDLVTQLIGAPIAAISLVDRDRQWFKAITGLDVRQTSRDVAFCAHAICEDQALLIADAATDPRFSDNPLVTGDPFIRSYAGAQLVDATGHALGTLCVIDRTPRVWSETEQGILKSLANMTIRHIEAISSARRAAQLEMLHETVVSSMAEGVVVHSADGAVKYANAAALSILGLTLAQITGTTSMDPRWQSLREDGSLFPGEDHPAMAVVRTGQPVEGAVMSIAHADGQRRWIKINARPVRRPYQTGGFDVVATFSDITAERQIQRELAAKRQRLDMALEIGALGVIERDRIEGTVRTSGSKEALSAFGPISDTRDGTLASMIPREHQARVLSAWQKHLEGGPRLQLETPLLSRDGSERWALVGAEKLLDSAGQHVGALMAIKDIHQRKMSEFALKDTLQKLEHALRAKDDFLANIGHEIRTPLNGVIGMASTLAMTDLTTHQREMAELIVSSGEVLDRLLTDLLDMSKLDAGKMSLELAPFDLCAAVVEAAQIFEIRADNKGVGFQIDLAPECYGAWLGDKVRVKQIVANLVSNAIKFTDRGQVLVRLSATGKNGSSEMELITLEVEDTGQGVSPVLQTKIFERFEQGETRPSRGESGTGLGLSICKSLAGLMGGEIALTSQPGLGSTFTVRLPLTRVAEDCAPRDDAPVQGDKLLRVLLVDDHPTNLRVVEAMLRAFNCEIVTAQDRAGGVAAFEAGQFDLVLMDMSMPVIDGITATRAIRAIEMRTAARRTPLAMLTAYGTEKHKRDAQDAGADFHIVKPVTPVTLLAGLEKAIRASKSRAAA